MKNRIVHLLIIPVAFVFVPIFLLGQLSPITVWKDLIAFIKSGEPFGPFDGGTL